ncbi:MAG: hypothetical protein EBR87_09565, partial [Cytophagia bacterium]|nr:hypothetical protein [Cytophagia bacterium]
MVSEAEKFKAEDEEYRNRIEAKNQLESYLYNAKSQEQNKVHESWIQEELQWLETHGEASREEYTDRLQKCIQRLSDAEGKTEVPVNVSESPSSTTTKETEVSPPPPRVEEVD